METLKRLKLVVNEMQTKENGILFIDEIHMLVGAGATMNGTMDATNLLKPTAIWRMRCIGATTHMNIRSLLKRIVLWQDVFK